MGKKKLETSEKKFKKLKFTAEEVDASIFLEGDPPVYRLQFANQKKGKKDGRLSYNDTLKRKIVDASDGMIRSIEEVKFNEGFRVVRENHRCYFNCPIKNHRGDHVVFFAANDLKPGIELQLKWDVKCSICYNHYFGTTEEETNSRSSNDSELHARLSTARLSVNSTASGTDNVMPSNNAGYNQHDIKSFFETVQKDMTEVFNVAYQRCLGSEHPFNEAEKLKTEICLKIAFAYSDSLNVYKNSQIEHEDTILNHMQNNEVIDQENSDFGGSSRAQATLEIARKNLEARLLAEQEQREDDLRLELVERQFETDIEKSGKEQDIEYERNMIQNETNSEMLPNTVDGETIEEDFQQPSDKPKPNRKRPSTVLYQGKMDKYLKK